MIFEENGATITLDLDKKRGYILVLYRGWEWEGR